MVLQAFYLLGGTKCGYFSMNFFSMIFCSVTAHGLNFVNNLFSLTSFYMLDKKYYNTLINPNWYIGKTIKCIESMWNIQRHTTFVEKMFPKFFKKGKRSKKLGWMNKERRRKQTNGLKQKMHTI